MKNQYRQITAEKLGIEVKEFQWKHSKMIIFADNDPIIDGEISQWYPDIDANQREKVEDWLIEQGCNLFYRNVHWWTVEIITQKSSSFSGEDKSKSTAFMGAFMGYINTGTKNK